MADRKKVIAALKRCSYDPDPGQHTKEFLSCSECPYQQGCTHDLMRDALELLREQEARVMTLDEIRSGAVEVAWIEDADKAEVIPGIWFRLSNEGGDEAVDIHIRDGFVGARLEVYGKLWRCWTARPTEEQMRETPWEGDSDAE